MNLFFLNLDPKQCAIEHLDKHCVKMILEVVQMLYTAHHLQGEPPDFAYRKAHVNHPTCVWIRRTKENYTFAVKVAYCLNEEYKYRYNNIHSCEKHINWLINNIPDFKKVPDEYKGTTTLVSSKDIQTMNLTPIPLAMPDECKLSDPVKSYRNYYIMKKARFAVWTGRPIPRWFTPINIRYLFQKTDNVLN